MDTTMHGVIRVGPWVLALLVGCPSAPPADDDDSATPAPGVDPLSFAVDALGPFHAGWRADTITYTPVGQDAPRTVPINVWYPTEAETGEEVRYMETFLDPVALGGAPVAEPLYAGRYPVMVYSHGFQGWGGSSSDLCRYFASHGWVVVAPDHLGNTLLDHVDPLPTAHYLHKPQDVSAALDLLEALPASDPLSRADTSRVLLSGHSFGSYATWAGIGATFDPDAIDAACAGGGTLPTGVCTDAQAAAFVSGELDDARVVAAMPMAGSIRGGFFGPEGHRSARGPVLFMSGTNDGVGQEAQWNERFGIDLAWLSVEGGCHQSFALGQCDTLDKELGFHIVDTYGLAFARATVLGDDDATVVGVLDGSVVVDALATYQHRTE